MIHTCMISWEPKRGMVTKRNCSTHNNFSLKLEDLPSESTCPNNFIHLKIVQVKKTSKQKTFKAYTCSVSLSSKLHCKDINWQVNLTVVREGTRQTIRVTPQEMYWGVGREHFSNITFHAICSVLLCSTNSRSYHIESLVGKNPKNPLQNKCF